MGNHDIVVNAFYQAMDEAGKIEDYGKRKILNRIVEEILPKIKSDERNLAIDDLKKLIKQYKPKEK